jgi:hypothetical protein
MVPYDGTPIKDELVRTGRLRGGVCDPDYDFLDPRLEEFYQGLTSVVNVNGWIHGLKAVTSQLDWAWHEVTVMERLGPALPGMLRYKKRLREITKTSNHLLLSVVEDLSYVYSDGKENPWDAAEVERSRQRVLDDLLATRNAFVYRHQTVLLDALAPGGAPMISEEPAGISMTA